jgi:RES domain-containing protein
VLNAWRIIRTEHVAEAFTGKGARSGRGRWHRGGIPIVYTASSISLATLELLVRLPRADIYALAIIPCYFPEVLVESIDRRRLPSNWRDVPPPRETQEIGVEWLTSRSSAVLEVPSAVTPDESNYLLNPEHPDFRSIDIGEARPFVPDLRLLT